MGRQIRISWLGDEPHSELIAFQLEETTPLSHGAPAGLNDITSILIYPQQGSYTEDHGGSVECTICGEGPTVATLVSDAYLTGVDVCAPCAGLDIEQVEEPDE